jgi:hypothetical protein
MKKHISLIIAIAIPIIMVLTIALTIYIPRSNLVLNSDFVYSVYDGYYSRSFYFSEEQGRIVKLESGIKAEQPDGLVTPVLYYYEAETESSRTMTETEAMSLSLSSSKTSPDGFIFVGREYNNGFMIFDLFGSDYSYDKHYIRKGNISKEVRLTTSPTNYYNVDFIGWVK